MNGRAERDSTSIQRGPPDPPMHRPSIPRAEARALACPAVERAAPSAPCNKTTVCDTRPFQEALNRNGRPMGSCQDRLTGAGVPAAAPSAALATGGRNVRIWPLCWGRTIRGSNCSEQTICHGRTIRRRVVRPKYPVQSGFSEHFGRTSRPAELFGSEISSTISGLMLGTRMT